MGTRARWVVGAGTLALSAIIIGSAIAQAIRQHSLDPVLIVGWLPAVMVASMYPALTGRGGPALPAPAAPLSRVLSSRGKWRAGKRRGC